jgi:hypothetical protein
MGYAGEAYGEADLKSNINVAVGLIPLEAITPDTKEHNNLGRNL